MVNSDVFDTHATEYDAWFKSHQVEYQLELAAVTALLPEAGEGVEIGVGTGRFAKPLGITLGVEPSEAMRNIALEYGVKAIEGTAESLPFDDASYDYALFVTTLCFLKSLDVAFKEVYRILKAQGFVIIGMIDKDSILGKQYEKKKAHSLFYKGAFFHSVEQVVQELKKAGFSNFEYAQALLPQDVGPKQKPRVKQGLGEGSFVVIRAQKSI